MRKSIAVLISVGLLATSCGPHLAATGVTRPGSEDCSDPVAGVWRAKQFDAPYGQWFIFTLNIKRSRSGGLSGTVVSRMWEGGRSQKQPPASCGGSTHAVVTMQAEGEIVGNQLTFGGISISNYRNICGQGDASGYYPDRFSGTVDPGKGVYRALLNDSGRAVNEPVVFRRTRCE